MSAVSAPKQPEMISIRAFAKRDGCSEKLVRNAIQDGDLRKSADGKLDAALVGSGWRLGNRRRADTPATLVADRGATGATPQQLRTDVSALSAEAARLAAQEPVPPLAESEARKEHYLAMLRKLEYEERSGGMISLEDADQVWGLVLVTVRSGFLALPTAVAPELVSKTAHEIRAILTDRVHRILSELAATDIVVKPGGGA